MNMDLKMSHKEWKEALQYLYSHGKERERLEDTLSSLKMLVRLSLDIKNRECVGERDIAAIAALLDSFDPKEAPPTSSTTQFGVWSETLKLLRNLCAELPSNQTRIINHPEVLPQAGTLVKALAGFQSHATLCTTALQLMANLCVGQRSGQEAVWRICFPNVFRVIMLSEGATGRHDNMVCMLLYYCTRDNAVQRAQLCTHDQAILGHVTSGCLATPSAWEWSSLLVASLLPHVSLRKLCPPKHSSRQLLIFLKFVLMHSEPNDLKPSGPHPFSATPTSTMPILESENVSFLLELFDHFTGVVLEGGAWRIKDAHATPTTDSQEEGPGRSHDEEEKCVGELLPLDFKEVRSCHASLSLLCRHASRGEQLAFMQATPTLLDDILKLLRELCTLDNSVSTTQNRSQLRVAMPTEREACHPLYGFKRDLVQLVGNLLYRCGEVQERVREGGGVSLILNQCGIDHRNPYIAQWAIFAIRNLCEDNPANQQLIAGLKAQGACPMDESALRAAGGVVEVGQDGKVTIKKHN